MLKNIQSFRGHLVNAIFGEGGTRLEDEHRVRRQNWDGERTPEAASREPLHLEEGVPVNHGEVSLSLTHTHTHTNDYSLRANQIKKPNLCLI